MKTPTNVSNLDKKRDDVDVTASGDLSVRLYAYALYAIGTIACLLAALALALGISQSLTILP